MDKIEQLLGNSIEFLQSPLSIDNSQTRARNGFYGFQNIGEPLRKTDKPFIFYEITGYGINLLLKLHGWYSDEKYLEMAKKAAECILLAQVKSKDSRTNGAIYDRYYPHSDQFLENFHVYPNAVCLGGLCEVYRITNDEKYLRSAILIKNWLFQMIIKEDQKTIGFKEFYAENQESKKILPYESICIPFILLKFQKELGLSGDEIRLLEESVQWGISSQTKEGYFPFFYHLEKKEFNKTAYSHFTIYPLYNLMGFPLAELEELNIKNSLDSFKKCADWMVKVQDTNGGFFTYYFDNEHVWHQQSPAVAQALCAFTLLYEKTLDKRYHGAATKAAEWIQERQITSEKFLGSYHWIFPNKKISKIQKKIMYAKEILKTRMNELENTGDVTVLLDKVPIWPVQFAIEGLFLFKKTFG